MKRTSSAVQNPQVLCIAVFLLREPGESVAVSVLIVLLTLPRSVIPTAGHTMRSPSQPRTVQPRDSSAVTTGYKLTSKLSGGPSHGVRMSTKPAPWAVRSSARLCEKSSWAKVLKSMPLSASLSLSFDRESCSRLDRHPSKPAAPVAPLLPGGAEASSPCFHAWSVAVIAVFCSSAPAALKSLDAHDMQASLSMVDEYCSAHLPAHFSQASCQNISLVHPPFHGTKWMVNHPWAGCDFLGLCPPCAASCP